MSNITIGTKDSTSNDAESSKNSSTLSVGNTNSKQNLRLPSSIKEMTNNMNKYGNKSNTDTNTEDDGQKKIKKNKSGQRSKTLTDYSGIKNGVRIATRQLSSPRFGTNLLHTSSLENDLSSKKRSYKSQSLIMHDNKTNGSKISESHLPENKLNCDKQELCADAESTTQYPRRRASWPAIPRDNITAPTDNRRIFTHVEENDHHLASLFNHIDSWDFDVIELSNLTKGKPLSSLTFFLFERYNLIDDLNIDPSKLRIFLRNVEETYRPSNPFHNSIHASDVTHAVHFVVVSSDLQNVFTPAEICILLLSATVHDADHPGCNNSFLAKSQDVLHKLHGDKSTLEQHHIKTALKIMERAECDILSNISEKEKKSMKDMLSALILATDIARHKDFMGVFETKLNQESFIAERKDHRLLLMQLILKCADINNTARSPHLSQEWTGMVMSEFFLQGDKEKVFGMPISMFMDRQSTSIPKCQVGFISFFVRPMFAVLANLLNNGATKRMLENIEKNKAHWEALMETE